MEGWSPEERLGSSLEPFGKSSDSHVAEISQDLLCLSQIKKLGPSPYKHRHLRKVIGQTKWDEQEGTGADLLPPSLKRLYLLYKVKTIDSKPDPAPRTDCRAITMEHQRDTSEMPHWALWTIKSLRSSSSKWRHCRQWHSTLVSS